LGLMLAVLVAWKAVGEAGSLLHFVASAGASLRGCSRHNFAVWPRSCRARQSHKQREHRFLKNDFARGGLAPLDGKGIRANALKGVVIPAIG
jgi:hypothetical protein